MSWAQRLKRVFGIEIETKLGVRRGAAHHRLHRRSRIDDLRVIEKILAHLHEVPVRDAKAAAAQAARPPPSRAASQGPQALRPLALRRSLSGPADEGGQACGCAAAAQLPNHAPEHTSPRRYFPK
jgi:hypothetical protein